MAVIWADFPSGETGLYGSNRNLMLNGVWAGFEGLANSGGQRQDLANDPDTSIGSAGRVFFTANNTTTLSGARFALPSGATNVVGVGVRLWLSSLPSTDWANSSGPLIEFRTAANNRIAAITVLANGAIGAATNINGTGILGTTNLPVVTPNAFNHIEVKMTRSSTVGEIEVRVNGVTVLSLDNLNLGSSDTGIIFIGSNLRNPSANINECISFWKDLVIWDNAGSQNNDFIGSVIVKHLRPNGDVALNGWTTSSGSTGFNLINQSPPNDATFIQADDTLPGIAQFDIDDLPPDIVTVKALIPITRSRKIDGGDGSLQTGLTGTLTDLGADNPITTAFTYRWDVSELSPDTGTPWTPVEVDAVRFDIDRTL
jgi:hypothetical protein